MALAHGEVSLGDEVGRRIRCFLDHADVVGGLREAVEGLPAVLLATAAFRATADSFAEAQALAGTPSGATVAALAAAV